MPARQIMRFSLHLSSERFLAYYRGTARFVQVRASDGRSLRFPANVLQPFVSRDGVHGQFEIEFDQENRFVELRRLSEG